MFVQILRVLLRAHDFLRASLHSLFSWPDSLEEMMVQVEKNGLQHCDISFTSYQGHQKSSQRAVYHDCCLRCCSLSLSNLGLGQDVVLASSPCA